MARMTDFFANKIIDHMLRGQAYTPPATVYVILFNGASASDLTAGTITSEIAFGGYSRKSVLLASASSRITTNTSNVSFDLATEEWTFTHFGLIDATESGNLLLWGEMPGEAWTVPDGQVLNFPVGNFALEIQ